jgi:hypothetical protein
VRTGRVAFADGALTMIMRWQTYDHVLATAKLMIEYGVPIREASARGRVSYACGRWTSAQ